MIQWFPSTLKGILLKNHKGAPLKRESKVTRSISKVPESFPPLWITPKMIKHLKMAYTVQQANDYLRMTHNFSYQMQAWQKSNSFNSSSSQVSSRRLRWLQTSTKWFRQPNQDKWPMERTATSHLPWKRLLALLTLWTRRLKLATRQNNATRDKITSQRLSGVL